MYWVFRRLQSSLKSLLLWGFNGKKFFLYFINIYLSDFDYCFASIVLKFTNLLFSRKDHFHSIFIIIFLCLKRGKWNSRSFYMSPKSWFLQSKTYILCLLLLFMRTLKFLERILIFTTVIISRHDENWMEEQVITKKKRLGKSRRSKIMDQKLSKGLKVTSAVGQGSSQRLSQRSQIGTTVDQRSKVRYQSSEIGSKVQSEVKDWRGRRSEVKSRRSKFRGRIKNQRLSQKSSKKSRISGLR